MNVLIKTATALGFILAIPLFALPAHKACHKSLTQKLLAVGVRA